MWHDKIIQNTHPNSLRKPAFDSGFAKYPGSTRASATPNESNTTQYPKPVHANDPICCPTTHNVAPSMNWKAETTEAIGSTSGGGRIRPTGDLARAESAYAEPFKLSTGEDASNCSRSRSIGHGEMGFHGLTGVGAGSVCSSPGDPPGSRKEKKL